MKSCLVFLGPPGAGKGTFAEVLSADKGLPHVSTGDIFREEIKNATELGKQAKGYVDSGLLVPDSLVSDLVVGRLSRADCADGYILDGFPRTLPQADLLTEALRKLGRKLDAVVYFKASDATLMLRLTARLTCSHCGFVFNRVTAPPKTEGVCDNCGQRTLCHRPDDSPETARRRLEVYARETAPLVGYYREAGLLLEVNSEQDRAVAAMDLKKVVGA